MEKVKRIMFVGPSGIGKTHLARFIAKNYGMPFISGSYSDLVPSTKSLLHAEMISKETSTIYSEDYQLLWARAKQYLKHTTSNESFVTDRSYVDNIAYFIFKLSKSIPKCETESFENVARNLLFRDCTHLIVMQCTEDMVDTWKVEDNNKRVLNTYFQWVISMIISGVLLRLGLRKPRFTPAYLAGQFNIKVLILKDRDLENNKRLITKFLGNVK